MQLIELCDRVLVRGPGLIDDPEAFLMELLEAIDEIAADLRATGEELAQLRAELDAEL